METLFWQTETLTPKPVSMPNRKINHRIKDLRKKRGLSQEGLSRLVNSNQNTIWKLETGRQELRIDQITIFADALGVNNMDILPRGFSQDEEPTRQVGEQEAEPYISAPEKSKKPSKKAGLVQSLLSGSPNKSAWVLRSRALENAGYILDDILILEGNKAPRSGDIVCAQIYDGMDARTVFRIYKPPYLLSATSISKLNDPILIDGNRVKIMGTVTESLRIND